MKLANDSPKRGEARPTCLNKLFCIPDLTLTGFIYKASKGLYDYYCLEKGGLWEVISGVNGSSNLEKHSVLWLDI